MVIASSPKPDVPSSPDTDTIHTNATPSELSTPLTESGRTSPNSVEIEVPDDCATTTQKKKKKKKSKKSKAKDASAASQFRDDADAEGRPPILCISRNKHWRYISSYHGPWLQLPVELLDSLLTLNLDPGTLSGPETRLPSLLPPSSSISSSKQRDPAQSLGINPLGNNNGGGRNVAMSATRIHRLRALAVQKLAQAYKADEIASSVMVMQGGNPNDPDARYVHFFHEKIPSSRQLAESTTTNVLDDLIAMYPQHLEYYRTRGIVHCFRDEFPQATKDFTHALKEARAVRKAKMAHRNNGSQSDSRTNKHGKRRKGSSATHTNGQAPPDGTSAMENGIDGSDGEPLLKHPSILEDAPDPIEPQLLFLRGAAYLQHAIHLIESAVLNLEGIRKTPSIDGAELRLCYIENGKYGGVEIGNPDGPLGKRDGPKLAAYSNTLGEKCFRDHITQLLRRSLRDHEKFLSHFDSLESPNAIPDGDLAFQTEYAFLLSECMRPGNHSAQPPPIPDAPAMFTTYHPLLVESHFSLLICELMLADFLGILPMFIHTASVVDGLEGYPIFLPPRSMAQAEFVEVLERLSSGWKNGIQPHSLSAQRGKSRLAIEGPVFVRPPPPPTPTYKIERSNSYHGFEGSHRVSGSSSSSSLLNHSASNGKALSDSSSLQTLGLMAEEGSNGHYQHQHRHLLESTRPSRPDATEALDCARILLAPVVKRQRERAERAAAEKASAGKKKPTPINIPLHGPRVEVILAWLGAVHLPELDDA
ncbi:hypothetical protein CVT25_002691 [Psilocybe cyanescens]|uniref:Uncharacterized protein n=1 Tax=Psilocybe cyanescens TaxID=93625 RepID=A0A409WLT1_PSICY|nr:hypothetical protein CVT25_002691 [Psilocybe cyanescens]